MISLAQPLGSGDILAVSALTTFENLSVRMWLFLNVLFRQANNDCPPHLLYLAGRRCRGRSGERLPNFPVLCLDCKGMLASFIKVCYYQEAGRGGAGADPRGSVG